VTEPPECLNCAAVLVGEFCHRCGQRNGPRVLPVRTLLAGLADDVLSWDTRLVRSLRTLLFRPGWMTREYVAGRRVDHIPPFRFYLLVSAVNLALAAVLRANHFFFFSAEPGAENARMFALLPRVMFLAVPVFAVLLAMMYRRRFFVEHLVFALHFHSAAFIIATIHLLLVTPPVAVPAWLAPVVRVLDAAVQIALMVYLYAALRRVYERSHLGTAASMAFVLAGYSLVLVGALFVLIQLLTRFR
jgi:hypothetical protein